MASALLIKTEQTLMVAGVLTIFLLINANVFCRFVLGFSLAFVGEVNEFSIIAITFAGMAYATNQARHIRMTAIYDVLPFAWQKSLMILIHLSTLFIFILLFVFSLRYVQAVHQLGGIYPATRIPYSAVYSLAPAGLFLCIVEYLGVLIINLKEHQLYLATSITQEPQTHVKLEEDS
ncbi:MAG: TRAP transporter small permease subunit [Pirellulaceae bacterium]